jgi:ribonuclease P protein subunit POP4
MRTARNILRHELIGLDCKIKKADNNTQLGIEGRIVDETRKTVLIETKAGFKSLPKQGSVFLLTLQGQKVEVPGDLLVAKPEDRIKKKLNSW